MQVRLATTEDSARVVDTLARAFATDPVWSWAFSDAEMRISHLRAWFELLVRSGLGNRAVWMSPDCESAAVWVPPGREELGHADDARLAPLLQEVLGPRADLVLEVLARFEAAHPHGPDHYHLSVIGTHPAHRGHGIGMALLGETLVAIDAEGAPAYLESTNPANVKRYEAVGFEVTGAFELPEDGPDVTTMWRESRR